MTKFLAEGSSSSFPYRSKGVDFTTVVVVGFDGTDDCKVIEGDGSGGVVEVTGGGCEIAEGGNEVWIFKTPPCDCDGLTSSGKG